LYQQHLNVREKKDVNSIQNMSLANDQAPLQNNSVAFKDQSVFSTPEQPKPSGTGAKTSIPSMNTTAEILDEKQLINNGATHLFTPSENISGKTQQSKTTEKSVQTISLKQFNRYWSITPYASVDFMQYTLDDDDRYPGNDPEDKQDIQQREKHQFSFSAGVLARWQFSPKISLKTGLVYSNIAIGIQPQTLYASADNNQDIRFKFITSSGYAYLKPVFA